MPLETYIEVPRRLSSNVISVTDLSLDGNTAGPFRTKIVLVRSCRGRQKNTTELNRVILMSTDVGKLKSLMEGHNTRGSCRKTVPLVVTPT